MSPQTIRKIDKWLGRPVCRLLTAWLYFCRIFFKHDKITLPKKILFIKLIEQGATVLAYPAIKNAAEKVGKENVYFCVFKDNRPILDILDMVPPENIFEIRQSGIFVFIMDVFSFLQKSWHAQIDSTVDMEFFSRASAILSYLSGAKNRAGLHRFTSELPYRGDLLTHRLPYNPFIHTAKAYRLLTDALFNPSDEIPMMKIPYDDIPVETPHFTPDDFRLKTLANQLPFSIGGGLCRPVVLLNPNASDMLPLRKWHEENFIELAQRLLDDYKEITIIITGAPSEKDAAEKICKAIREKVPPQRANYILNFAGKTTLYDLLLLYTIADALITNDSGPGHFASMTSIQTIILFGPETPTLFGPLGKNIHVIWKNLACSPCVNAFNHRFSPCNDNVCMKSITVEEVYGKVKEVLLSVQAE